MVVEIASTVQHTLEDKTESRLRLRLAPIYSVGICGNKMMQVVKRADIHWIKAGQFQSTREPHNS
jgi:hypothetical protein